MITKRKLFLASSSELKDDREAFEIFINRKNKDWVDRGVFLDLILWEDFLDAVSRTRLQDEYNKEIKKCDVFVMLFWTKVGQYTEEEFEAAFGQFKKTERPFIFTYFKDVESGKTKEASLVAFQQKLATLGHYYTRYTNIAELNLHFSQQLDKLVANGFIEFEPDDGGTASRVSYDATLTGNGTLAQGPNARAVGAGGVLIGGNNAGPVNTGTQIDTGGGAYIGGNVNAGGDFVGRDKIAYGLQPRDLEALFRPLLSAVTQQAPAGKQTEAVKQVEALKAEVAKDKKADDGKIAKIIEGLVEMVPGAVGAVVSTFATPILGGIAGPVTKYVLGKLQGG